MSKSEINKEKTKVEVKTEERLENKKTEVKSSSDGKFDWMKEALENCEKVRRLMEMNISEEEKNYRFMTKDFSGEEAVTDSGSK